MAKWMPQHAPPHRPCKQLDDKAACACGGDAVYMHRDTLTRSLDGLPIEVLTISSVSGVLSSRNETIAGLYPDPDRARAHNFEGKKVSCVCVCACVCVCVCVFVCVCVCVCVSV